MWRTTRLIFVACPALGRAKAQVTRLQRSRVVVRPSRGTYSTPRRGRAAGCGQAVDDGVEDRRSAPLQGHEEPNEHHAESDGEIPVSDAGNRGLTTQEIG